MNFDDIKKNWDKESAANERLLPDLSTLRKAQHPVDKLRGIMKKEFFLQVIAVLMVPFLFRVSADMRAIFISSYMLFVAVSTYYLYCFYRFYNGMHNYSMETKDGLQELYYELRLNMERYKSFGFLLLPFIFIFLGFIEFGDPKNGSLNMSILMSRHTYVFISLVVAISVFYIVVVVAWVDKFYGKYAAQIKGVLDELKEEQE